jgi:hypothetical protein
MLLTLMNFFIPEIESWGKQIHLFAYIDGGRISITIQMHMNCEL